MNKQELISHIAKEVGVSEREGKDMVNAFIDAVVSSLKAGKEVVLTGFGTFSSSKRKARMGRNPRTGEEIKIPAVTVPKFKAGKSLKDALR